MTTKTALFYFVLCILFTSGCARKYHPVKLATQSYQLSAKTDGSIRVSYDTLALFTENRRYARKANKHDLQFIRLRLDNTTNDTIRLRASGFVVTQRDSHQVVIPFKQYAKRVKQTTWTYLLLIPLDLGYSSSQGLVLGSIIRNVPLFGVYGVTNFIRASKANSDFRKDLGNLQLNDEIIPPKQTIYRVICIKATNLNGIQVTYQP